MVSSSAAKYLKTERGQTLNRVSIAIWSGGGSSSAGPRADCSSLPGPWEGLRLGPPAALTGPSTGGRMPPLAGDSRPAVRVHCLRRGRVHSLQIQDKPASPHTARGGAMPLGHAERATMGLRGGATAAVCCCRCRSATAAKNLVR